MDDSRSLRCRGSFMVVRRRLAPLLLPERLGARRVVVGELGLGNRRRIPQSWLGPPHRRKQGEGQKHFHHRHRLPSCGPSCDTPCVVGRVRRDLCGCCRVDACGFYEAPRDVSDGVLRMPRRSARGECCGGARGCARHDLEHVEAGAVHLVARLQRQRDVPLRVDALYCDDHGVDHSALRARRRQPEAAAACVVRVAARFVR
mmetsp:Transcript_55595/g.161067  ORF Transcript_55595/g.161067 Transcript_55595/m.161067 type:complete len:202 (-) Transcript_55595:199-804(-)